MGIKKICWDVPVNLEEIMIPLYRELQEMFPILHGRQDMAEKRREERRPVSGSVRIHEETSSVKKKFMSVRTFAWDVPS
jgi:hypothetical protein